MATLLKVTAQGRFSSGAWLGEEAQIGWNLISIPGGSFDTINVPLPAFSASPAASTGVSGLYTVTQGWGGALSIADQEDVADCVHAYLNSVRIYQTGAFRWEEIRVAAIEADGSYVNGASFFTLTTPLPGTGGTPDGAPQDAVVTSVVSGGRGPRNRNRWYLPYHENVDGNGLVPSATITALLGFANTLYDSFAAVGGGGLVKPVVASQTYQTYSDVIAHRIGDELDNQRRRRNARPETYSTLVWP